jgi:hypothetical protein
MMGFVYICSFLKEMSHIKQKLLSKNQNPNVIKLPIPKRINDTKLQMNESLKRKQIITLNRSENNIN